MSKRRLFVGNFPFSATEQELRDVFAPRNITEVKIIVDRESGRSRGFGFVELATDDEAADALSLNGRELGGRALVVSVANERPSREGNGGRGGDRPRKGGQRHDGRRGRGRDAHGWD